MKTHLILGLLTLACANGFGEQLVAEYKWQELADAKNLTSGKLVQQDGRTVLKIENTNSAPLRVSLLTIENPKITTGRYALVGEVKYENVQGDGYLETWNHFPAHEVDGEKKEPGKYFSRTLGATGPMAKIVGTSTWRDFILPFNAMNTPVPPSKIEFNLFLPAEGTVYLSPVRLLEYKNEPFGGAGGFTTPGWWSHRAAGWIGGLGGALFGCLAGLMALLASKGRARAFVIGSSKFMLVFGAISLAAAAVALAQRQPYEVWFPLLLLGGLLMLIIPTRMRDFQRNYEQLEMRRIASLDT